MTKQELAKMIDHTLLKPDATKDEIRKLCEDAKKYLFKSVCVNPVNVSEAYSILKDTDVLVCTVIGFPLGASTTAVKAYETENAVLSGASEIDMVINIGALKGGDYDLVHDDIFSVVRSAGGKTVKVIIETSLLTDEEKVKACELAKRAGAHFVKTSTGFSGGGATANDIRLMRETVGKDIGVKASGGIRSLEGALEMIKAGANRIGTSSGVKIIDDLKE